DFHVTGVSDVCSSDLNQIHMRAARPACGSDCVSPSEPFVSAYTAKDQRIVNYLARRMARTAHACGNARVAAGGDNRSSANPMERSEERRVGKEGRAES